MKFRAMRTAAVLAAFGLTLAGSGAAMAAPAGSLSGTCTATKVGPTVYVTANMTYNAYNNNNTAYQINGYRIDVRNNGGQRLRTTDKVSIAPTYAASAVANWTIPFNGASSLSDFNVWVYNGNKEKATLGWTSCTRNY